MTRQVVVSGGGTGIGRAVAAAFAHDGDRVVIVGRRLKVLEETARELPGEVVAVQADLTVPADVQRVADEVGAVDVIVNNAGAGIWADATTLEEHAAAWRAQLDANVLTAVLLTTALLPALRRPGGRILMMSSIAGLRGGAGSYSAAKSALHGWALDLATRLGKDGVTVNVVAPGFVPDTEFFDEMTPEFRASRVAQTLVGRAGTPDEIAAAVRYLASAEAGFVTGQILQVNGGALLGRG